MEIEEKQPINSNGTEDQPRRPKRAVGGIIPSRYLLAREAAEFSQQPRLKLKQILTEFTGTAVFAFFGGLSLHNRTGKFIAQADIVSIALTHGLTIAILASTCGHISGGHFNPAVSLGIYLAGGVPFLRMLCYWLAQILGAFLGGLFIKLCVDDVIYMEFVGGTLNPNPDACGLWQAVILEMFMTYFLVHTVLVLAVDPIKPNKLAPWGIGLSITVDIFAGGTITGASMNPARSWGPLVAYSAIFPGLNCTELVEQSILRHPPPTCVLPGDIWAYHWIAWVGPLAGSILAGIHYRFVFVSDHRT